MYNFEISSHWTVDINGKQYATMVNGFKNDPYLDKSCQKQGYNFQV
jgi:hypothetical protein